MTYELSNVEFTNDFFSLSLPDGSTLVMNRVSEALLNEEEETEIKGVNIVVVTEDVNVRCSSVVGTGNSYFTLSSDYSTCLGKALTSDIMPYCYLEIPEDE